MLKNSKKIICVLLVVFFTITSVFQGTLGISGAYAQNNNMEQSNGGIDTSLDGSSDQKSEEGIDASLGGASDQKDENNSNESTLSDEPLELRVDVDGVDITLNAEAGAFPKDASLEVSTISNSEQQKVDKAVDKARSTEASVAASYTYDIKVLDADNNELQPADGKSVAISFALDEVADEDLNTHVYHIKENGQKLKAEALSVSTEGDTATVETDGFSYYTVEFTYGDKQYVLEGGGVIKLDDLLTELGIEGEVKRTTVSAPKLFNVIRGSEDSPRYLTVYENSKYKRYPANDPKGTVRWVVSYEPFDTEEWMDVVMADGTTYHVIVTDALINGGFDDVSIDGLAQGVNPTFSANMPVADIWIDERIVNQTVASRNAATFIPGEIMDPSSDKYHKGFFEDKSGASASTGYGGYPGNHYIAYDTKEEPLTGKQSVGQQTAGGVEIVQSYNEFIGVVGTYKWENAAVGPNGELLDVYVEYSDPIITVQTTPGFTEPGTLEDAYISLFGGNMMALGAIYQDGSIINDEKRVGLGMTIRPYVTDKEGNIVSGNFYYPMTDIDVKRTAAGYGELYGCYSEYDNYDPTLNKWSETVILNQGLVQNSNGDKVFIPGDIDLGDAPYTTNIYKEQNGAYVFTAGDNGSDDNTFYSGFMTLVTNDDFSLTWRGSTAKGNQSGINTNILCGMSTNFYNFKLRHSTQTLPSSNNPYPAGDDGGNIATTREGNRNGKLDDGQIINPSVIATANGQSVTYTFYPQNGYGLRELWLWDDQNYTYATAPADKRSTYEWADGADRYRYLNTFGEVNATTQKSNEWVYDGFVYTWDGTEWQYSLTYSSASLRDKRSHDWIWTDSASGLTYTFKYENKEWHRYLDPNGSNYEVVTDPEQDAVYSGSGIQPPSEATSPSGAGEWHLFKYFNQVDDATQKASTWVEGDYTYEYITGGNPTWMRSIHFEDVNIAERAQYTWYEEITDGVNSKLYEYRYEDDNWHKYDVTDQSNPKDLGEQNPPGNALTYEWDIAPPDSAVSDYGERTVPDNAINAFPTTDAMREGVGRRIFEGDGHNDTYVAHDDDGDGNVDRYTYTFDNIDNNHAIHVVWGQTILEIRKQVTGNDVVEDTFTFRVTCWGDEDKDGITDYVDFREAELYDPSLRARFALVNPDEVGGRQGVYQFTLSGNTSIAIPPELIPVGFSWEAWEVPNAKGEYGTKGNWEIIGSNKREGSFDSDDASAQANFLNRRDKAIDPSQKLTVVKVWENDSKALRPDNITMTIKKPTAIGIPAKNFATQIKRLVSASSLTGIKYGTATQMKAVPENEIQKIVAASGKGEGTVYLWKDGNDVYFYSESEIYLTGSAASAFSGCTKLADISGLEHVHTDFVTNMQAIFAQCYALANLGPLSGWNTRNVTNMKQAFGAGTNQNAGNTAATRMTYTDLTPLSNWDTQNVTDMSYMFAGSNISDLSPLATHKDSVTNVVYWDVSRVTTIQGMFVRTFASDYVTTKQLETWDVGAVKATSTESSSGFYRVFYRAKNNNYTTSNSQLSVQQVARLPDWSQEPSKRGQSGTTNWNRGNGSYIDPGVVGTEHYNTSEQQWNDEAKFWRENQEVTKYITYHKVDPNNDNIWIYEFEVDADDATWRVYETLPGTAGDYYSVSATEPVEDSNATYQKWIYNNDRTTQYDTKDAAEAKAVQDVVFKPSAWVWNNQEFASKQDAFDYVIDPDNGAVTIDPESNLYIYKDLEYASYEALELAINNDISQRSDKWAFNGVDYDTQELAEEAAKASVTPIIIATKWFYDDVAYDTYEEAEAAAYEDIDSTTNPGKWIFDGVTYDTEGEAKAAATAALSQIFIDKLGTENNPVTGAKAGTTTTIKNTRKEVELKIHKDATAAGLADAQKTAKTAYMQELAAAETNPTRKAALENEDESVLTNDEKAELKARQDAACTFTFTLKLWDDEETNPYNIREDRLPPGVEKVGDGLYRFTMIPDPDATEEFFLPIGTSYRVEETASEGWHLTSSRNTKGTLTKESTEAFFLNTRTDVINVVKQWEDDEYSDAIMNTRPTGRDSLGIEVTTLDSGTRWKQAGTVINIFATDTQLRFDDVKSAWEGSELTPDVRQSNGTSILLTTDPKYVYLTSDIHDTIPAGDYVIDKKQDNQYLVIPVENVPFEKTYTSSDASNFLEDDGANTWRYQFAIPSTEKVIDVKETSLPSYYQKVETSTDASGRVVYNIVNTLDKRDLRIEKNTKDNEEGVFDYEVKFFVEADTENRHPYNLNSHQKPVNATGSDGTYYFSLRNGQEITFKDLPVGVSYEVIESHHEGWDLVSKERDTGMIKDGATEKWAYTRKTWDTIIRTEYNSLSKAEDAVNAGITGNDNNGYRLQSVTYLTREAAELAAMDAVEVGEDGSTFYVNVDGTKTAYSSLTDAQNAAKDMINTQPDPLTTKSYYFVDYDLVYPNRASAERAAFKAIEKAAYTPRTAKFTNEKEKGDLEIIKETILNDPGTFRFRVKIWDIEDVYEFKTILTTGNGTESVIKELMAAVAVLPLEASHGIHQGIMDYVAANSLTTDKTAVLIKGEDAGIQFTFDEKTYHIGTYDYCSDVADPQISSEFKAQAEAAEGNTQLYILEDKVPFGALSAQYTKDAEHPLVLTKAGDSSIVPVSGDENKGIYEFKLTVDANNATNHNNIRLFKDIPYGYQYEVWELTPAGWELISISNDDNNNNKADGTMLTTGKYSYTFTNDRLRVPLTIGKIVTGNQGSRDKYFKYKIEIENAGQRTLHLDTSNATHEFASGDDSTAVPNAATIYTRNEILNGQTPAGSSESEGGNSRDDDGNKNYQEAKAEGWEKNCEWTDGSYTYRWSADDDCWEKYEDGTKVEDDVVVPDTATRTFAHGQHIKCDSDGKATIYVYLQHGQTIQIRDLPVGTKYTVTEVNEDYKCSTAITGPYDNTDPENPELIADTKTGENWDSNTDITGGSPIEVGNNKNSVVDTFIQKATELTFTNMRSGTVPTEVRVPGVLWALVLLLMSALWFIYREKKKRRAKVEFE